MCWTTGLNIPSLCLIPDDIRYSSSKRFSSYLIFFLPCIMLTLFSSPVCVHGVSVVSCGLFPGLHDGAMLVTPGSWCITSPSYFFMRWRCIFLSILNLRLRSVPTRYLFFLLNPSHGSFSLIQIAFLCCTDFKAA